MLQLSGRNKITGAFNLNAGGLLLSNAATANPGVQSLLRLDQPLVLAVATASGGAVGQSVITTTLTNGLFVGMEISGTGIPAGTVITAVSGNTNFTISSPLTSTATGTYVGVGSSFQGSLGFAALNVAAGTFLSAGTGTADFANQLNVNGSFAFEDLGRLQFNGNIVLAANSTINIPAPQALMVFRGSVSGTGVVTKEGLGTLWFGHVDGFTSPTGWGYYAQPKTTASGGIVLNNGTLVGFQQSGQANVLGTGTITMNGGQLSLRTNWRQRCRRLW